MHICHMSHSSQPDNDRMKAMTDLNAFRRDYSACREELTVNSRPIIQNLSMFAQEHSCWAEIVSQCVEAHIQRVSERAICIIHSHTDYHHGPPTGVQQQEQQQNDAGRQQW